MANKVVGLRAEFDVSDFNQGLNAYLSGINRIIGETSQLAGVGSVASSIGQAFAIGLGIEAFQAVSNFIDKIGELVTAGFHVLQVFEQLELSLRTYAATDLKSADATLDFREALNQAEEPAQALLGWLERLAVLSPFTTSQVAQVYKYARGVGLSSEFSQRLTQDVIDLASATGATAPTLQRIVKAFADVEARGKLAATEVNQFANAGIPIRRILTEGLRVTNSELEELQKNGDLVSGKVLPLILNYIETNFGGMGAELSRTFTGLISSLQDIGQISLRDIFKGLFEPLREPLQNLIDLLTSDVFRAGLKVLGENLGQVVTVGVNSATEAFNNLLATLSQVSPATYEAIAVFLAAGAAFTTLLASIGGAAIAISILINPFTVLITVLAALTTAWVEDWGNIRTITEDAVGVLTSVFNQLINFISSNFSGIADDVIITLNYISEGFADLASDVIEYGQNIVESFAAGITSAVNLVVDALSVMGDAITYLLEPGSPPRLLPDLDKWGTEAANVYLQGWTEADFDIFDKIGNSIKTILQGLAKSNQIPSDFKDTLTQAREVLASAIGEIVDLGHVTQETYAQLANVPNVGQFLTQYVDLYESLRVAQTAATAAQEELNKVNREFEQQLRPLRTELLAIQNELTSSEEEKTIKRLRRIIGSSHVSDERRRKAQLQLDQILAQQQIRNLELQKQQQTDVLQTQQEAAQTALQVAQQELSLFEARLQVQISTNELLAEENKLASGSRERHERERKTKTQLEKQLDFIKLQQEALQDVIKEAKAKYILESATATEAEKVAAQLDLQEIALRRQARAAKAIELGFDPEILKKLESVPVTLDDMGIKAKKSAGGVESLDKALGKLGGNKVFENFKEFQKTLDGVRTKFSDFRDTLLGSLTKINKALPSFLKIFPEELGTIAKINPLTGLTEGVETLKGKIPILETFKKVFLFFVAPAVIVRVAGVVGGLVNSFRSLGVVLTTIVSYVPFLGRFLAVLLRFVPYVGLISTAVSVLYVVWTKNFFGIQEKVGGVLDQLQDKYNKFTSRNLQEDLRSLQDKVGDTVKRIREFFADPVGSLKRIDLSGIIDPEVVIKSLLKVRDSVVNFFKKLNFNTGVDLTKVFNVEGLLGLLSPLAPVIDAVGGAFNRLIAALSTVSDFFSNNLFGLFTLSLAGVAVQLERLLSAKGVFALVQSFFLLAAQGARLAATFEATAIKSLGEFYFLLYEILGVDVVGALKRVVGFISGAFTSGVRKAFSLVFGGMGDVIFDALIAKLLPQSEGVFSALFKVIGGWVSRILSIYDFLLKELFNIVSKGFFLIGEVIGVFFDALGGKTEGITRVLGVVGEAFGKAIVVIYDIFRNDTDGLFQYIGAVIRFLEGLVLRTISLFGEGGAIGRAIGFLGGAFERIQPAIKAVGLLFSEGGAFAGVATVFGRIGAVLGPVVAKLNIIAFIVTALAAIWRKNWLGMRDVVTNAVSSITSTIQGLIDGTITLRDLAEEIQNFFTIDNLKTKGQELLDFVKTIPQIVTDAINQIKENPLVLSDVILELLGFSGEGGSISENIGAFFVGVRDKIVEFFSAENLSTILTAVKDFFVNIYNEAIGFFDTFDPKAFFDSLVSPETLANIGQKFVDWAQNDFPVYLQKFGEVALTIFNFILAAIPKILYGVGQILLGIVFLIVEFVPRIVGALIEFAVAFVQWIAPLAVKIIEGLGIMLADVALWLVSDGLPLIIEAIIGFFSTIGELIPILIDFGVKMAGLIVLGLYNIVVYVGGPIADMIGAIGQFIQDGVGAVGDALVYLFTNAFDALKGFFGNILKTFVDFIVLEVRKYFGAGAISDEMAEGLLGGLNSAITELGQGHILTAIGTIIGLFKTILGIASPSKKMFDEVGNPMGVGVINGVKEALTNGLSLVKSALSGLISGLFSSDFLQGFIDSARDFGGNLLGGIQDGISSAAETLQGAWNDALNLIGLGGENTPTPEDLIPADDLFNKINEMLSQGLFSGLEGVDQINTLGVLKDQTLAIILNLTSEVVRMYTEMKTALITLMTEMTILLVGEGGIIPNLSSLSLTFASLLSIGWNAIITGQNNQIVTQYQDLNTALVGEDGIIPQLNLAILELLDQLSKSSKEKVEELTEELKRLFRAMVTELHDFFKEKGYDLGDVFVRGIAKGMLDNLDKVKRAAEKVADAASSAAANAVEAKSPSRRTAREVGKPFTEGIAKGILGGVSGLLSAVTSTVNQAVSAAEGVISSRSSSVTNNSSVVYDRTNNYYLNVNSTASSQGLVRDFNILQTLAG